MRAIIETEPQATLDYVSVTDAQTWVECTTTSETALASVAVRFGTTRLIDNTLLYRQEIASG
jgi:pantoate--beta-alanine ligase